MNIQTVHPTFFQSVKNTIFHSWLNLLLIFFPIGIVAFTSKWPDVLIFTFNGLAIIPLAGILGFATEELSKRTSQSLGGLLNATFGNLVELLVAILALKSGLIDIVQASLLGSILSNILLVLGMSFFFGGLKFKEQTFNIVGAQALGSMMTISCVSIIIPAAFWSSNVSPHVGLGTLAITDSSIKINQILAISRGISLILIVIYILFLIFQLRTHTAYFSGEEEEEKTKMNLSTSILVLFISTVMVAFSAEYMVDSIQSLTINTGISPTFIGLIVIPIVGNAAEHYTAVLSALKGKMDLSIGVAMGSATQVALFVTPFVVLVGWIIAQPMTLEFTIFESITLFLSVFLVNGVIQDGKSNWLEGFMLMAVYCIIAIAFWYS